MGHGTKKIPPPFHPPREQHQPDAVLRPQHLYHKLNAQLHQTQHRHVIGVHVQLVHAALVDVALPQIRIVDDALHDRRTHLRHEHIRLAGVQRGGEHRPKVFAARAQNRPVHVQHGVILERYGRIAEHIAGVHLEQGMHRVATHAGLGIVRRFHAAVQLYRVYKCIKIKSALVTERVSCGLCRGMGFRKF